MVKHLAKYGFICAGAYDIEKYETDIHIEHADARTLRTSAIPHARQAITNPPWDRKILHSIIENLSFQLPTWLLFDSDWAFTKQSAYYMQDLCTDMIAVGRVKWFPESKMTGKDNVAWYRFWGSKSEPTRFFGRSLD